MLYIDGNCTCTNVFQLAQVFIRFCCARYTTQFAIGMCISLIVDSHLSSFLVLALCKNTLNSQCDHMYQNSLDAKSVNSLNGDWLPNAEYVTTVYIRVG